MTDTNVRSFAVVTDASTGIGFHLARIFTQNGFDVLVTTDEERIFEDARELEDTGAQVYSVQADLSKDEDVERLWSEVLATGRSVDAIALSAGFGEGGDFVGTDLKKELKMIDLNVKAVVHLPSLPRSR